jgi:choline kinase
MKNVFILAAGNISNKLSFIKASSKAPALIPVNTKPLVLYHLEFYRQFDCRIHIVVNRGDSKLIEDSVNLGEFEYQIIEVPGNHGVNASLQYALEHVEITTDSIVNLVTTVPTHYLEENAVVLESNLSYNDDWSCVTTDTDNISFWFRSNPNKATGHAFMGLFSMDTSLLMKAANQVMHRADLLEVFAYLTQTDRFTAKGFSFKLLEWIDVGHAINYYRSKLKLISSRSFNAVQVNDLGVLKKRSSNYAKLEVEEDFISSLPSSLSILFPRIISPYAYDSESKTGSYAMEFYGYPSIAELQLFWDLQDEAWTRMFEDIEVAFRLFMKHNYSIGKGAYLDFYVGKIADRVKEYEQQMDEESRYLISENININGNTYKSFDKIKDKLFKRIEKMYNEDDFCIVHGDLCFNNLLYDVNHRLLRLIDPRGSFGNKYKGVYGDIKYDLAKLLHSAVGGYDYLVNNLYKIEIKDKTINYKIFYKASNKIISRKALRLVQNLGYDPNDIMLIVGTLFLTMPPLHNDSTSRQKAMYIHGLKLINENL